MNMLYNQKRKKLKFKNYKIKVEQLRKTHQKNGWKNTIQAGISKNQSDLCSKNTIDNCVK